MAPRWCMRIGSADAIVIRTMVTAKNLAINAPRLRSVPKTSGFSESRRIDSMRRPNALMIQQLLRFERKVGRRRCSTGHSHFRGLGTKLFLPRRHRVISRRHIVDGVMSHWHRWWRKAPSLRRTSRASRDECCIAPESLPRLSSSSQPAQLPVAETGSTECSRSSDSGGGGCCGSSGRW